ncbi:MAG: ATP-dependent RNA helicase, partial [Victivallales bacterium]|nr:ATP-dependent RNA helicase [Victivallales bacterium]
MNQRLQLPVTAIEAEFRRVMRTVGTAAVSAPTGSGKSTQIPQWLLTETPEDSRIIVLQPRRLAARMLAERVACELGEKPGERVGYVTRFEHVVSPRSRIVFVTEGILTRMLLSPGDMDRVSAVMFDEFHQRSINADLGLAMAAELRRKSRPDLKLIVTSATLDSARVCTYLEDCPSLVSEGKLHPVEISYIRRNGITDCCRLAADAVQELLQEGVQGDILVFMPGVSEIRRCGDEIRRRRWGSEMEILPLYGDMSPQAQRAVMEPAAKRKIIIATNIAETSLTIPGVRIVVDSGLVRLNRRDALRGVDVLETVPICADAAAQRAGRAGREAPGRCIRLWSAIEQDHKKPHTPPEIQRLDLADPLLSVHAAGFRDDRSFPWFEAPPEKNADAARALLYELELLDGAGALTERGRGVRAIPAHPRLALLLLEGALSGCRELACGCAALLSGRPMLNRASGGTLTELRGKERRNSRANDAPASDFTAQLQLLHQAEQFHFRQDECASMGVNGVAAAEISRDMKFFLGLRLPAPLKNNQERSPECALAQTLLKCFPDKLARKLDQGSLNCELQGRKRAQLSP